MAKIQIKKIKILNSLLGFKHNYIAIANTNKSQFKIVNNFHARCKGTILMLFPCESVFSVSPISCKTSLSTGPCSVSFDITSYRKKWIGKCHNNYAF